MVNPEFIHNWEKLPKEVQLALTTQIAITKKAENDGKTSLSDNIFQKRAKSIWWCGFCPKQAQENAQSNINNKESNASNEKVTPTKKVVMNTKQIVSTQMQIQEVLTQANNVTQR